jgi:hypothetical protein
MIEQQVPLSPVTPYPAGTIAEDAMLYGEAETALDALLNHLRDANAGISLTGNTGQAALLELLKENDRARSDTGHY